MESPGNDGNRFDMDKLDEIVMKQVNQMLGDVAFPDFDSVEFAGKKIPMDLIESEYFDNDRSFGNATLKADQQKEQMAENKSSAQTESPELTTLENIKSIDMETSSEINIDRQYKEEGLDTEKKY